MLGAIRAQQPLEVVAHALQELGLDLGTTAAHLVRFLAPGLDELREHHPDLLRSSSSACRSSASRLAFTTGSATMRPLQILHIFQPR